MNYSYVSACQDYLLREYRERLQIDIAHGLMEGSLVRKPTWVNVSLADMTRVSSDGESDAAGLLLDPEIGVVSYIIPFENNQDLRRQVTWALKVRARLAEGDSDTSQSDIHDVSGAWRVTIHWLVDAADRDNWQDQITNLRRETAFSEEITFDALGFDSNRPIAEQIAAHSFPRLLIATREILRQKSEADVQGWLSANSLVLASVQGLASSFRNGFQRALAAEVVAEANRKYEDLAAAKIETSKVSAPMSFKTIRIKDFRNLRNFELDFGLSDVSARVVHGPNGTGKSSVSEAIALGLFGASSRYAQFSSRDRERDVTSTKRDAHYIDDYLAPLDNASGPPTILFDGEARRFPQLAQGDDINDSVVALSGTVLTQDASANFARLSADELGSLILRGYSDLADHLEDYCERRVAEVQTARQNLLRRHNLSAAITKIDTAFEKIAKAELDRGEVAIPQSLINWLRESGDLSGAELLLHKWMEWDSDAQRKELLKSILKSRDHRALKFEIQGWIEQRNDLASLSATYLETVRDKAPSDATTIAEQLVTLCGWVSAREKAVTPTHSQEASEIAEKLETLKRRQAEITKSGRESRARAEHLASTEGMIHDWITQHPQECPTCGCLHVGEGGILQVVADLRSATLQHADHLRAEFMGLKSQIDPLQQKLVELGATQPPLTSEEISKLDAALAWLIPSESSLLESLGNIRLRDALQKQMIALSRVPVPPEKLPAEELASELAERITSAFTEAQEVFDGPGNWLPVKEKLSELLTEIVSAHLPNTLVRLWNELSMNLTSAPWLLPDRPTITVKTDKGRKRSLVQVRSKLARYILNEAELQTLGLAWFFVRYLTHGRFFHSCLLFDDPAQQMDQTSFRDLCRLWETWIRLHRIYSKPLQLVILLNQENRALDAARATNGVLNILSWTFRQNYDVERVSFEGNVNAVNPASIFHRAAAS